MLNSLLDTSYVYLKGVTVDGEDNSYEGLSHFRLLNLINSHHIERRLSMTNIKYFLNSAIQMKFTRSDIRYVRFSNWTSSESMVSSSTCSKLFAS